LPASGPPAGASPDAVVLVDTVGEQAKLYAVADLVFVGGTLTKRGGQNMMEPAGLGKPVVVGPATWNFRDPVELLVSAGGLTQCENPEAVRRELLALHADPARRLQVGRRARGVCLESKGATRRILDILRAYVPSDRTEIPA
jgi:3-deoxy-D-manno-octulosonic-acid transferase